MNKKNKKVDKLSIINKIYIIFFKIKFILNKKKKEIYNEKKLL